MNVGALIEPRTPGAAEFAVAAEAIGVASLWVPEVWGYDALTGLAYLAAKTSSIELGTFVVQLGSRSPALPATSALSTRYQPTQRGSRSTCDHRRVAPLAHSGVTAADPLSARRHDAVVVPIVASGPSPSSDFGVPFNTSTYRAINMGIRWAFPLVS